LIVSFNYNVNKPAKNLLQKNTFTSAKIEVNVFPIQLLKMFISIIKTDAIKTDEPNNLIFLILLFQLQF